MKTDKLLIRNARIINPESGLDGVGSIYVEDGTVSRILMSEKGAGTDSGDIPVISDDTAIIDADGLIAAPGLIDIHVHFRDPGQTHKEDIDTGSACAAAGGFTSVVMMANTSPSVDNADTLSYVLDKAAKQNIHVYAAAAVSKGLKGESLTDYEKLADMGAVGFTDDGIPLMDADLLREAMLRIKQLNMPISLHEEDPNLIENSGVNAGVVAAKLGLGGASREAEYTLIDRDIQIGIETGVIVNIQHISSSEGVELVRRARAEHDNIHAEATPHHFTLTQDAVLKHGTLAKMNPPVREEADRLSVIKGLQDGTIELIATDHAPHAKEEKDREFTKAPSGIIGLETSLALGITELVKKGYLSYSQLIEKMSLNPARLYNLNAGRLGIGCVADIVLFDPDEEWIADEYVSKSSNTPFTGMKLTGRVKYTITDGRIVYSHNS